MSEGCRGLQGVLHCARRGCRTYHITSYTCQKLVAKGHPLRFSCRARRPLSGGAATVPRPEARWHCDSGRWPAVRLASQLVVWPAQQRRPVAVQPTSFLPGVLSVKSIYLFIYSVARSKGPFITRHAKPGRCEQGDLLLGITSCSTLRDQYHCYD